MLYRSEPVFVIIARADHVDVGTRAELVHDQIDKPLLVVCSVDCPVIDSLARRRELDVGERVEDVLLSLGRAERITLGIHVGH